MYITVLHREKKSKARPERRKKKLEGGWHSADIRKVLKEIDDLWASGRRDRRDRGILTNKLLLRRKGSACVCVYVSVCISECVYAWGTVRGHLLWICVCVCTSLHVFQTKLCVRVSTRVRVCVCVQRLPCMFGFYRDCLMKWHVIHSESADTRTDALFHTLPHSLLYFSFSLCQPLFLSLTAV